MNSLVLKNTVALFIVQFSNYIAPLLVLPYLSRVLTITEFGVIMMALSFCSLGYIITDYGFSLAASYWVAKNKEKTSIVSEYVSAVFIIKTFVYVLLMLGVFIYSFFILNENQGREIILLSGLAIFFQMYQPIWFFQGIEKMKLVTAYMLLSKLLFTVLVFILVKNSTQINYVIISLITSNALATLLSIYFLRREGCRLIIPSLTFLKCVFKDASGFFVSRLSVCIYTSANTLIVGGFAGSHQAAIYSAAEKLYQAGQNITSPISQALYPYLARTGNRKSLYSVMLIFFPVLLLGSIIVGYFSSYVFSIIFGSGFEDSVDIFYIFILCLLVTFISVNLGYPAFASIGKVDIVNKTVIIGGVLQLLMLVALYFIGGLNGVNVAFCVLITEVFVLVMRVFLFVRHTRFCF